MRADVRREFGGGDSCPAYLRQVSNWKNQQVVFAHLHAWSVRVSGKKGGFSRKGRRAKSGILTREAEKERGKEEAVTGLGVCRGSTAVNREGRKAQEMVVGSG